MDIALAIEGLIPAAQYTGSVTDNAQGSYETLVWEDTRLKPTWQELLNYWISDTCKNKLAISKFDIPLFQTDLRNALPTLSNFDLRWEFAALNTYATNSDFEGLRNYLLLLQSGGVATQGDVDAVIALITKQGIIYG